jgi:hypothetical protein
MVSGAFAREVSVEGLKRKNAICASCLKRKFDASLSECVAMLLQALKIS